MSLLFNVREERIWRDKEVASSPRDGRELRFGKEKHEAEAGTQVILLLYPRHEKQTKNPAETTGIRYKIEILMSRMPSAAKS